MIRVKISLGSFFLVYKSCIDCALKGVFLYPELIEEEELQSNKAHTSQPGDSFIIPVFHLRFVILCIYFHNRIEINLCNIITIYLHDIISIY